jgi:hypothetical protein
LDAGSGDLLHDQLVKVAECCGVFEFHRVMDAKDRASKAKERREPPPFLLSLKLSMTDHP